VVIGTFFSFLILYSMISRCNSPFPLIRCSPVSWLSWILIVGSSLEMLRSAGMFYRVLPDGVTEDVTPTVVEKGSVLRMTTRRV
jgi:hypothetical protein